MPGAEDASPAYSVVDPPGSRCFWPVIKGMAGTALAVLLESSLHGYPYPLGCVPSGTVQGSTVEYA